VNWPIVAALAAAGLVIGWCLRPVVFWLAVPPGEPLRDSCPRCGHRVLPADRRAWLAVPRLARCPACRARIGAPPLVPELVTAILLGALAGRIHPGLVLAAACWLAICAVALAWIDAAVQRLPDILTAGAYAGTMVLLLAAATASGDTRGLLRAALGGPTLAAGYLTLAVISRSAIGLGDAKLAASLGTLTAWFGWPELLAGAFAGFLLGAGYGVGLLVSRRATARRRIAFGPFMIAGAFLAVLAAAAGSHQA
jgi:leader peptidase (prepilin peptidase) / N-methyltransferase